MSIDGLQDGSCIVIKYVLMRWPAVATMALLLSMATPGMAGPTTAAQARKVVRGWLRADSAPLQCRLGSAIARVDSFADDAGQILYHVVSLNPSGFVIVSADDQIEPIVCFAPTGVYDSASDNPLATLVNRDMRGRAHAVRGHGGRKGSAAQRSIRSGKWRQLDLMADGPVILMGLGGVSDVRVAPFVASRWSQQTENGLACYNYYTPPGLANSTDNYPSGCVATAMAQLIRYYQWPTAGIGTHYFDITVNGTTQTVSTLGGDGNGGPYNWALMMLDPNSSISAAQREAIGALCFDAGASVKMMYAPGGSGAYVGHATTALVTTFGYSNAIDGDSGGATMSTSDLYEMINPNMDAGYPVLLGIANDAHQGHAVVVDGYGYSASTLYHHLNMGWAGYQDAWYNLPLVETVPYTFTAIQDCCYNIYPYGSGEILSGRVTDPAGNPLGGLTVTAQRAGGGTYTSTTTSAGIYVFPKVPASSVYTVRVAGGEIAFASQTAALGTSTSSSSVSGNRWALDFPRRQIYTAWLDVNPGWTLGSGWAWGTPTGGGSYYGDPTSGHAGTKVVGYNLNGNYARITGTNYATLGPVDCTGCTDITLGFYRRLGVDSPSSDQANIQISTNGTTWTDVWRNDAMVQDNVWQHVTYALPSAANMPAVYIRWGMGPTDFTSHYPGWNIDDVEITGQESNPMAPTDPQPTDTQTAVPLGVTLSWNGGVTAPGIIYDVYFDTVNPPAQQVASDLAAAEYSPGALSFGTTYYWRIEARNAYFQTPGPVWSFRTAVQGDIDGNGVVGVSDLQMLVLAWGTAPGAAAWNAATDLDVNELINVGDLQLLVLHWGQ